MRADAAVVGGLPAGQLHLASDQRLVEQVRSGSDRAFETLFDRHHRSILSFCLSMLGSHEDAEDAAQQTFLVAYRDLVRAAEPMSLRPWLFGIARHRCLTVLRRRRECPVGGAPEPRRSYDLTAELDVRADVRALLADVAGLPAGQRTALVLAELGDLSHEEIARVLRCRREKVKALVFQARTSLSAARDAREMPCAQIREQLTTLRGPALRRTTLRRHLSACAGCRAYREAVRSQRRRLGAWLPTGFVIALKRYVVGTVCGSGTGAGSAVVTGGALGGVGLVTAALVAVSIPVGGSTAAMIGARDGDAPVRPVARAGPVIFGAAHAGAERTEQEPSRCITRRSRAC